jgi:hypothetical protein
VVLFGRKEGILPSWKKVVISGSDAALNSLDVTNTSQASTFSGSLLRLDENGTGLRMTNIGAFDNSSGDFRIFSTNNLVLATNGENGEVLHIKSNGNILIGTTTDSGFYKVDIDGTTRITGDTSTNGTVRFSSDKGTNNSHIHYGTDGDWYIRSATANGKVVIQDVGAVVGIGTSSPNSSYKLDINGDTNVAGDYYHNGTQGYTGNVTIQQYPPNPPITLEINGGIITNVT